MKRTLKTLAIGFGFLVFFLFVTFPYSRLAPKLRHLIETGIRSNFGISVNCEIENFDLYFPVGIQWSKLSCLTYADERFLEITDGKLLLLPSHQSLSGRIGKGDVSFKANAGLRSMPSRISSRFGNVPLEQLTPILLAAGNRMNSNVPRQMKITGVLNGTFDLPLTQPQKENGSLDLRMDSLAIPSQSLLDLIGLKDLTFSKATAKASITGGKLTIVDTQFLSDHLSAKVDGQMDLQDEIAKSAGSISLKWKVSKSDALLSTPIGQMLAHSPCPSPDTEGFCTRKIQRLSEMNTMFY